MPGKLFFLAILALGSAFVAPSAHATTMSPLTLEQMTDASDLVVRATVTQVWSERDARGNIRTRAQLEVASFLKGAGSRAVIVEQVGGILFGEREVIPMAARFSVGEDGVFFLEEMGPDRLAVVGWSQGKFTVRPHPMTGREMVVRFTVPQDRPFDHRFIPHPPEGQQIFLDEFVLRVTERVEIGWDGLPIPGADPDRLRRINRLQPGVN